MQFSVREQPRRQHAASDIFSEAARVGKLDKCHRHILVNSRTVDIPSYRIRPGDEVRVSDASRELALVKVALELAGRGQPVSWIQVDSDKVLGKMTERPTRDAIPVAAQEQLIVELYSK